MKKKIYLLVTVIMIMAMTSSVTVLAKNPKPSVPLTEQQLIRLQQIERRIEEIKNIDRSTLNHQERKALRKELLEMKKEAKVLNGVYLSVGTIIIIILLLILILN